VTYEIIPKETEAIKHAIKFAEEGSFITCLSDVVINAIEIVQEYLDRENEHGINFFMHIKATGNSSFFC
jgi:cyanophycin synthetase